MTMNLNELPDMTDALNKVYEAKGKKHKEPRWQDDDCDGKWYEKSDVDGKISKREKKAKEKAYAEEVDILNDLSESGLFSDEEIEAILNMNEEK